MFVLQESKTSSCLAGDLYFQLTRLEIGRDKYFISIKEKYVSFCSIRIISFNMH